MRRYTVHSNNLTICHEGNSRLDSCTAAGCAQMAVEDSIKKGISSVVYIRDELSRNIVCKWEIKDGVLVER